MPFWLRRGGNASLKKEAPGLKAILIGLGWDARTDDGTPFDLDACVFLTGADGKVRHDVDLVFYNNLRSADGSVEHLGDHRTGDGEGDDEVIKVDLTRVAPDVAKIVIGVTIHAAEGRGQSFGMVKSARARVLNAETQAELGRYELTDEAKDETALIFAELYRHEGDWKFRAVGQGFRLGLGALAASMGVATEPVVRA